MRVDVLVGSRLLRATWIGFPPRPGDHVDVEMDIDGDVTWGVSLCTPAVSAAG